MFWMRSRIAMLTANEAYAAHLRETTVGDCLAKGWALVLTCKACGRAGEMPRETLAALPAPLTLEKVAAGARCSECGRLGAWIDERQVERFDNARMDTLHMPWIRNEPG